MRDGSIYVAKTKALRGNQAADLHLCFGTCKKHVTAQIKFIISLHFYRNRETSSKIAESQLDGFLSKLQQLISATCHIIIYYMALIILKELLGTVLWIYIKRYVHEVFFSGPLND